MPIAIVAIPEKDDYVWRISSEKVPHMTLLFLGDDIPGPQLAQIEGFLEHVVRTSLRKFGLSVSKRDLLGDNDADVAFFMNDYSMKRIEEVRSYLLAEPAIRDAYDVTEQYPVWQPHLTLGYPETPAKPDSRDYPGINWVRFDRIALWMGDYDGPEFELTEPSEEVCMSDTADRGALALAHHGIRGMKWGVRRSEVQLSADKTRANEHAAKVSRGRTSALSNKELQELVTRMNLEQQYKRLAPPSTNPAAATIRTGYGFVKTGLDIGRTVNEAMKFVSSPAGKLLKEKLSGG